MNILNAVLVQSSAKGKLVMTLVCVTSIQNIQHLLVFSAENEAFHTLITYNDLKQIYELIILYFRHKYGVSFKRTGTTKLPEE